MNGLEALKILVANTDSESALARFKLQGQEFSRKYAQFVMNRDYSFGVPEFRKRWIELNNGAMRIKTLIKMMNAQFDSANRVLGMVFGENLINTMPEISNGYLLSSNAALIYIGAELDKFNHAISVHMAMNSREKDDGQID